MCLGLILLTLSLIGLIFILVSLERYPYFRVESKKKSPTKTNIRIRKRRVIKHYWDHLPRAESNQCKQYSLSHHLKTETPALLSEVHYVVTEPLLASEPLNSYK